MVSIIIPCYNVADYISSTLESVINQIDTDWEIIAVDDGSTDNTLSILKKYAESEKKIRIVSQSNKGVSAARNIGIKASNGDIIYFLDGDDYIDPSLTKKINRYGVNDFDVIMFGFRLAPIDKYSKIYMPYESNNYLSEYLINNLTLHISSLAFNKRLIINNNIRFDENTYYSEDREFVIKSLFYARKITVLPKILFSYYQRDGSAMHIPTYNEKHITSIYALERMYNFLEDTIYGKYALSLLNLTIILHQASIIKYNRNDKILAHKLSNIAKFYLKKKSIFSLKKSLLLVNLSRLSIRSRIIHKYLINFVSAFIIK